MKTRLRALNPGLFPLDNPVEILYRRAGIFGVRPGESGPARVHGLASRRGTKAREKRMDQRSDLTIAFTAAATSASFFLRESILRPE